MRIRTGIIFQIYSIIFLFFFKSNGLQDTNSPIIKSINLFINMDTIIRLTNEIINTKIKLIKS